jgi:SAM-dependent methyltransferase
VTSQWDAYWRSHPFQAPEPEPALSFVLRCVKESFGALEGVRTLELGSGRGTMSLHLAKAGANVTLVDSSEVALKQAEETFDALSLKGSFVAKDIFSLDLTESSFDVAMSFGLVEHFLPANRGKAIRIHRAGRIGIVAVPNALCVPYRLWKLVLEGTRRWPYGLERPFTKGELLSQMRYSFNDVKLSVTPLSYTFRAKFNLRWPSSLPLDARQSYQIVACGSK